MKVFGKEIDIDKLKRKFPELSTLITVAETTITKNFDGRAKSVGDRVVVWDGSALTDMSGNKMSLNNIPFNTTAYFVVAEIECVSDYRVPFTSTLVTQDLIIVDVETNVKYKVFSDAVKLYVI